MFCHRVNNIKISFKIESSSEYFLRSFARESHLVSKTDGNFFVLRDRFVFVIFFTGHVNCTKLRTFLDIEEARSLLDRHLLGAFEFSRSVVDNISASGSTGANPLNLRKFASYLGEQNLPCKYNPERFPGLNFRLSDTTFVLFRSGKFLAVGSRSLSSLAILVGLFSKYLDKYQIARECRPTVVATRRE